MNKFKRISVKEVEKLMQQKNVTIVDIRDRQSHLNSNIINSKHVTSESAANLITTIDRKKPLIIYCYHGISSQDAAQYFSEQGFSEVYSMDGGFEAWRVKELRNH